MPVGTKGTVKTLLPSEVASLGADVILGNTYHLHFRPGEGVIEELGGLHAFTGWSGPIPTDSGGFQVFSLRDTLARVDDEGVTFRSVYDGSAPRLTPEGVAEIQRRLGSDIAMCLDICPPADVAATTSRPCAGRAWAERQVDAVRAEGQLRFGIAQGGTHPDLRGESIDGIVALPFDGFALGGWRWGEPRGDARHGRLGRTDAPAEQPRYFMGLGDAEGILEVVARGIDMFDCVLPTRTARTGSALTARGRLNLRNARFARDPRPLEESCGCPACAGFSRAFVRHLVNQQELLGHRLLTLHNLWFTTLTAGARDAIIRGTFDAYRADALAALAAGPEEDLGNADSARRDVRPAVAADPTAATAPAEAAPARLDRAGRRGAHGRRPLRHRARDRRGGRPGRRDRRRHPGADRPRAVGGVVKPEEDEEIDEEIDEVDEEIDAESDVVAASEASEAPNREDGVVDSEEIVSTEAADDLRRSTAANLSGRT